jgi:hypothetical protein
MNLADKPTFVKILMGLALIKPGPCAKLTDEALDLWWRSLAPTWTLIEFADAAAVLISTIQFMPTPYDFAQLRKAARQTSGEAWTLAVAASHTAIECGQVKQNATSNNALIDKAVRAIGGYGAIALCDVRNLGFLERRFCEHFNAMSEAQDVREALPQLTVDRGPPARLTAALQSLRLECAS